VANIYPESYVDQLIVWKQFQTNSTGSVGQFPKWPNDFSSQGSCEFSMGSVGCFGLTNGLHQKKKVKKSFISVRKSHRYSQLAAKSILKKYSYYEHLFHFDSETSKKVNVTWQNVT